MNNAKVATDVIVVTDGQCNQNCRVLGSEANAIRKMGHGKRIFSSGTRWLRIETQANDSINCEKSRIKVLVALAIWFLKTKVVVWCHVTWMHSPIHKYTWPTCQTPKLAIVRIWWPELL